MSRTPVSIYHLPHVVVEHALMMAPLEDRVRFTTTCTRFRQLGAASTALWRGATFDATKLTGAGTASFVAWLASPAGRRLKSLLTFIPRKLWQSELLTHSVLGSLVGVGADGAAASAAGHDAALVSLRCSLPTLRGRCGVLLSQLPRLRHLDLYNDPGEPQPVQLPAEFSGLTQLTCLRAAYLTISLPPGCLPASLLSLAACLPLPVRSPAPALGPQLPAAITTATQLEYLSLSAAGGPLALNTAGLERLTRLTYLSLEACHLQQQPAALVSLHALRALCLVGNPLGDADLSLLATLPALRELDLCFGGLTDFSPDLLCLTGLEALSVSYNNLPPLPADLTDMCQLEAFGCDADSVLQSGTLLSRLSALTRLCLTQLPDVTCAHHLAGLFQDLRRLPHLRVLGLTGGIPGQGATWSLGRSREVAAPLTAAMPALEVQAAEGLALPAELAMVPWDEVQ